MALSKDIILQKNADFLQKKICKIKRALVLKDTFSETIYECILTYEISSF